MAIPTQNFTRRLYHGRGEPLPAGVTVAAYALAVATMYGVALLIGTGKLEVAIAQVMGLGLVPLALARAHDVDHRQLGITRPPALVVVGAVVCGAGLWWLALKLAMPVIAATDREAEVTAWSQALFAGRPSWLLLVTTMVIVPSLCEELAHRGLLAAGLTPRLGRVAALAIATGVFAALHLEPGRIAATALLGAAASAVAAWGRSLLPAVTLHAVNNLIVTLLGTDAIPAVTRAIDRHPTATTAGATALTAVGLAIAFVGRAAQSPRSTAGSGTVRP